MWYTDIAVKNISTVGKGRIIQSLFKELTYDEHPKTKYTAEWKVMLLSIESASNFTLLNCPASISATLPNPPTQADLGRAGANKRKVEVDQGGPAPGSPSKQGKRSMKSIH